jgi:hypothetical protein
VEPSSMVIKMRRRSPRFASAHRHGRFSSGFPASWAASTPGTSPSGGSHRRCKSRQRRPGPASGAAALLGYGPDRFSRREKSIPDFSGVLLLRLVSRETCLGLPATHGILVTNLLRQGWAASRPRLCL